MKCLKKGMALGSDGILNEILLDGGKRLKE